MFGCDPTLRKTQPFLRHTVSPFRRRTDPTPASLRSLWGCRADPTSVRVSRPSHGRCAVVTYRDYPIAATIAALDPTIGPRQAPGSAALLQTTRPYCNSKAPFPNSNSRGDPVSFASLSSHPPSKTRKSPADRLASAARLLPSDRALTTLNGGISSRGVRQNARLGRASTSADCTGTLRHAH